MTCHFWHCFEVDSSLHVLRCLRRLTLGPLLNMDTREDWGPLEWPGRPWAFAWALRFSQSSTWPVRLVDIRLVQDEWQHCGAPGPEGGVNADRW